MLNDYFTADDVSTYSNNNAADTEADIAKNVIKTRLDEVFGMPYQFMDTVDMRLDDDHPIGIKYSEKILSSLPLLFLAPCRQKFAPGFDSSSKEMILESIENNDSSLLDAISSSKSPTGAGRYYTTEFAFDDYYSYVNIMCHQLAQFLGISNEMVIFRGINQKIGSINWMEVSNASSSFRNYFGSGCSSMVIFYADGLNSMSDTFSNDSTESSLASQINGYSSTANEIRFLLGNKSALANMGDAVGNLSGNLSSALSGYGSSITGGLLSDLATKGVSTVVNGGKVVFPKIWDTSSFGRSYDFDFKLRTPDHDNISIYFNILVPFIHLLAMTLPVGLVDKNGMANDNAFVSPFLVKSYCKGMFNIDMGMITGLQVTRGAQCQWNDDGLPTQIDISLSIEDLYSSLYMTNCAIQDPIRHPLNFVGKIENAWSIVHNTAMMDYLANLSGINIADEMVGRRFRMFKMLLEDYPTDALHNMYNKFDNSVLRFINNVYKQV